MNLDFGLRSKFKKNKHYFLLINRILLLLTDVIPLKIVKQFQQQFNL